MTRTRLAGAYVGMSLAIVVLFLLPGQGLIGIGGSVGMASHGAPVPNREIGARDHVTFPKSGPHPNTVDDYEQTSGAFSLDPAVDYETTGLEPIANVYQTLITYNGSLDGPAPNDFVPDLATCVPGSTQCQSLYGTTLQNNSDYTFVINPSARFYDPSTQTAWAVYPNDVVFSIARTCLLADYPGDGVNPGWILCQALLPNGNSFFDSGLHSPYNSTPENILASMTMNGSACPSVALTSGNGCVTFSTQGSGEFWPEFLEFLADPLGASILPCGWASSVDGGLPGWNCGWSSNPPGDTFGPGAWDSYETGVGSSGDYQDGVAGWAQFLRWNMTGSGPFYLAGVSPTGGYQLKLNPDWSGTTCSWAGCISDDFPVEIVNVVWEGSSAAPGLAALQDGQADLASVPSANDTNVLDPLIDSGAVTVTTDPSLSIDFTPFNLDFNGGGAQGLLGGTSLNAPSALLQDLDFRQFLVHAFPYETVESQYGTVDGLPVSELYGGAIPEGIGNYYPENITWDDQDPGSASANSPQSPIYWWNLVESESGPGAYARSACSPSDPCVFPFVEEPGQPDQAISQLWASDVSAYSEGAVEMVPVAENFSTIIGFIMTSPGNNPAPLYDLGWSPDYPDPTDYVSPLYLPDQTFTGPDAVAESLSAYQASCGAGYVWAEADVTSACQGTAYAEMVDLLQQAGPDTNTAQRTLLYNAAEHIAQQLGLFVPNPGQQVTEWVAASWLNQESLDTNPMLGGLGATTFYTLNYTTGISSFRATPNPVEAGAVARLTVSASGGSSPYGYSYTGLPAGCVSANTSMLTCSPTTPGTYTITVSVTNGTALFGPARAQLVLQVEARALSITSFAANPNPVVQGSVTTFTVQTLGGQGTDTFYYSGLPLGCPASQSSSFSCTPTSPGTFVVSVNVIDSSDPTGVATASLTLTVSVIGSATITNSVGSSPTPGTIYDYEQTSGAVSLDPAVDYETTGYEPILNVYQTLITYNGSQAGPDPNDFVPDLATCVPGSEACERMYGSSLQTVSSYTFVINPNARFYDPATQASWAVYPNDVLFSIARTCLFADYPGYTFNPGWILCQALLPSGNGGYDQGLHAPLNSTPYNILQSMQMNGSACPAVAISSGNGCITFQTEYSGQYWPEFLELVADALGGSILPCGWVSANGGDLPGWNCGWSTDPALGTFGDTAWDSYETGIGNNGTYGGNVAGWANYLRWNMVGSGPYDLSSVTPGAGYVLSANPAWTGTGCDWSGCLPASFAVHTVHVIWESTFTPGEDALDERQADFASVPSADYASVLNPLVASGEADVTSLGSFTLDFTPFDLDFNEGGAGQLLNGSQLNAPSDLLQDLDFRQFLVHAYPYASIEADNNTVDGYIFDSLYGGAIPEGMGDYYPGNISWPDQNPLTAPSDSPLSALYWWDLVENETGAGAIARGACTVALPCVFPYVEVGSLLPSEIDSEWASEVWNLSGGAVKIILVPQSFGQIIQDVFGSSPGNNPAPMYDLGWAPDYPDPSDYVVPLYMPNATYTYGDADEQSLQGYDALCPSGYAWAVADVTSACQGQAYGAMVGLLQEAAGDTNDSQRAFLYNEAEHIAQQLALFTANQGQVNQLWVSASWIAPSSINANPMIGGSGDNTFYTLSYATAVSAFTASSNPVAAGSSTTLHVNVVGGTGPYSYNYTGLPPGCASASTSLLSCTPTTGGTFAVTVTVTDSSFPRQRASATMTLRVTAAPLTVSGFAASPNPVSAGSPTTFAVDVAGGSLPYTFTYNGLPAGCPVKVTTSPDLTCTPTLAGVYVVLVTVSDSGTPSQSTTLSTTLTVTPSTSSLVIASYSASPDPVTAGSSTTFQVLVSGGIGPDTYHYAGLPTGCSAANISSLPCTPLTPGSYSVTVTVTDNAYPNPDTASATLTLKVRAAPLTVTSFEATPADVPAGTLTTFNVGASGGTAPYTYSYGGLPDGCGTAGSEITTSSSFACSPTVVGDYTVTLIVTDSSTPSAQTATVTTSLTVSPPTSSLAIRTFTASMDPATAGSPTVFAVNATGGTPGYAYTYVGTGLPASCSVTDSPWATLSCTPTTPGTYTVMVTVNDSASDSVSATLTLKVSAPPLIVSSFSVSTGTVTMGTLVTFTVVASGGTKPYTDSYAGLPAGCGSAGTAVTSQSTFSCTPTAAGAYTVTMTLSDSSVPAQTTTLSTPLTVTPSSSTLAVTSYSVSSDPTTAGNPITFTATAGGGTPGYGYTFVGGGLPAACSIADSTMATLTCTPSEPGTYSVSVTVNDSASNTASASLTLRVLPAPLSLAFQASPSTVTAGGETTFTVTTYGGTPSFTYSYSGLPAGCGTDGSFFTIYATMSCYPENVGTYTVTVTVSDDSTPVQTATISTSLTVTPSSTALSIGSITASSNPVSAGSPVTLLVGVTGGSGGNAYSFSSPGLPAACSVLDSSVDTLTCTPTTPGEYTVTVTVNDSASVSVSAEFYLRVLASPLAVSPLSIDPNPADVGTPVTFSVTASGGSAPYTYAFGGLPAGCGSDGVESGSAPSLSCTPTQAGTFTVTVTVSDSATPTPQTMTVSGEVEVMPSSTTLVVDSFSASVNPVIAGTSTIFSVSASEGTPGYAYTFDGVDLPASCSASDSSLATLTCVPSTPGSYTVTVTVNDSASDTASASLTLRVVAAVLTVTSFTANPNPATAGSDTQLNVVATGGTGPYNYTYSGLPSGCLGPFTDDPTCVWASAGSYTILVTVTDSSTPTPQTVTVALTLEVDPNGADLRSPVAAQGSPTATSALSAVPGDAVGRQGGLASNRVGSS